MTLDGPRLPAASGAELRSLVVLLHGYGSNGDDLIALSPLVQPLLGVSVEAQVSPGIGHSKGPDALPPPARSRAAFSVPNEGLGGRSGERDGTR